MQTYTPRVVHSVAIVSGGLLAGLAYEFVCRPFDAARRYVHAPERRTKPMMAALVAKVKTDGILFFFKHPLRPAAAGGYYRWLRVLGRVGPWGVGFLVWENVGPGEWLT